MSTPTMKTGSESFHFGGDAAGFELLGFWRWYASDLVGNALRGCMAEYIAAKALGIDTASSCRVEWDAADLRMADGTTVEVKSAAYWQSWKQERPSEIRFDIRPTHGWEAATNEYSAERRRQADVYVFCLLAEQDRPRLDPLDLDQWQFLVLPTKVLDDRLGGQKSVGLSTLERLGASRVFYEELAEAVDQAAGTR